MNWTSQVLAITALFCVGTATMGQDPQPIFTRLQNVGPDSGNPAGEFAPSVSADVLTLFFFSADFRDGVGGDDIWMATRSNVEERFSNVVQLGSEVNSTRSDAGSSISADGLTLYFASGRDGNVDLYQATRNDTATPFGNVKSLGPGVNNEKVQGSPNVSADGLTLVYHQGESADAVDRDVWIAARESTNFEFGNARFLEMNRDDVGDWWPSLSSDG